MGEAREACVLVPFPLQCCRLCGSRLEPQLSNQRLVWDVGAARTAGIARATLEDLDKKGSPEAVVGQSQEVFLNEAAVSESR